MIAAIIQARMTSTRLPGKIMLKTCNKTFLHHMIDRVKHSKTLDKIVIATTINKTDDTIEDFCRENNIVYLGIDSERLPIPTLLPSFKLLNGVIYVLFNHYMRYKSCYKRNKHQSYIKDKVSSKYLSNESFDSSI